MNKKNRTYLLVIAVIVVWGTIAYKLFSNSNPDLPKTSVAGEINFKRIQSQPLEKIVIQPDYRDPFLGKLYRKKKPARTVKKVVKKPTVVFPQVLFIGFIEGAAKSYILQINGRQEIFAIGQTFQDITLKSVQDNEIVITYKGESRKIPLKE